MDLERFRLSPVGHLTPITVFDKRDERDYDHQAFVPLRLPREIPLSQRAIGALTEATLALGRLDGMAHRLPNPLLLVRPVIAREAVSTSALEGTYAGVQDVFEADLLADTEVRGDLREVRNYVRATERAIEEIKTRPISIGLISELQAILVAGTRGDSYQAGAPRKEQVWIGPREARLPDSRFVPPPPTFLAEGIRDWEHWIHGQMSMAERHDVPPLVRIIVGHYQFETLHPFHDGNGRIGRLLVALQLLSEGIINLPVLYFSPYLDQRREEYISHLTHISETGDFEPWILFFAEVLQRSAEDAGTRIQRLLDLKEDLVQRLRARGLKGTAIEIVESLIGYPILTPSQAATRHGVAYPTANNAIGKLVEAEVLVELTGRKYGRVFACVEVIRTIE